MDKKKIVEIEVLGSTKEEDYTKPIQVIEKRSEKNKIKDKSINSTSTSKPKRRLKKGLLQKIFCILSALFILGCFILYGSRLVKYYRIYNPKDNTNTTNALADAILKESSVVTSGEGLYRVSGSYIYKGQNVNNYLKYSNFTWRILKIGTDGTIDLILDDSINVISFDKESTDYRESDINEYLNKVFIKNLNTDLLVKTSVCLDKVEDVNSISCNDTNVDNYVKIIDISTFLNSKVDDTTFISDEYTSNIWTSNTSNNKVWSINGLSLSQTAPDEAYFVKPVVTLNNTNKLLSGKGTKDKPYEIEKKNGVQVGDYVQLGEDNYIIYEMDKDIVKLQSTSIDKLGLYSYSDVSVKFDINDNSSVANYLNTEYYNSLSYKDKLEKTTWYTGRYNGKYNDIYKDSAESYIGMLNVSDIKFGNLYGYYLLTPVSNNKVYIYEEELEASKTNITRYIRPTIAIKKNILKSGKGLQDNPYKVGE
ncbi:MAG: hypothetical protein ACI4OT_05315 [Bacilli bacterium]